MNKFLIFFLFFPNAFGFFGGGNAPAKIRFYPMKDGKVVFDEKFSRCKEDRCFGRVKFVTKSKTKYLCLAKSASGVKASLTNVCKILNFDGLIHDLYFSRENSKTKFCRDETLDIKLFFSVILR